MDKLSASNFAMDSSAVPNPSEGMSSPPPSVPEPAVGAPDPVSTDPVLDATDSRQHPIPPASEPMQYRAIGLVYGKYTPSEEQFTKGDLHTEDGTVIDSVLLGRVMSLVKKHIDLEKSHLWVVYPRTREKQYDLHLQIMGIWEPENLSQPDGNGDTDTVSEDIESAALPSGATTEPTVDSESEMSPEAVVPDDAALVEKEGDAIAEDTPTEPAEIADAPTSDADKAPAVEATEMPAIEVTEAPTAEVTEAPAAEVAETPADETTTAEESVDAGDASPAAAASIAEASTTIAEDTSEKAGGAIAESTDGYFSIRGEILFYAEEDDNLVVRIQQSPRKEGKPPKAFKLILDGKLEGKTVGYFWELHVQREGNRLVVQDGTRIAMVPPKKNKKRRSGPGGPPRPRRQNGGPRKPWKKDGEGRSPQGSSSGEVKKPIKRVKRVMKPLGGD